MSRLINRKETVMENEKISFDEYQKEAFDLISEDGRKDM